MTERRDHRYGPAIAAALLMVVPALYPLSLGPAVVIFDSMGQPHEIEPILEMIYSPLMNLPEPFESVLDRYVELWGG